MSETESVGLCRDCLANFRSPPADARCPACGSPRLFMHPELDGLAIVHIDCDAFYAAIEKRDNPALAKKPVIVGGGRRGVVAAACYVARMYGVRSAMPMFKALEACPEAVVIRPDMAKYRAVGAQIRTLMEEVTPLVQPLSIDEAFLDLGDSTARHGTSPAHAAAALARRIEHRVGVTVSVGLSYNKFLAKVASDLDKPRGFAAIGRKEAKSFLAGKPVRLIWGVGRSLEARLRRDGISAIGQLQTMKEAELVARYGAIGSRLYRFARGEDDRPVVPRAPTKSVSAETTFEQDLGDLATLCERLYPLCRTVARRLESKGLAGQTITLKLKRADFRTYTRRKGVATPTQRAETIFALARTLLERETTGIAFRLIGVGVSDLTDAAMADPPELFDVQQGKTPDGWRALPRGVP